MDWRLFFPWSWYASVRRPENTTIATSVSAAMAPMSTRASLTPSLAKGCALADVANPSTASGDWFRSMALNRVRGRAVASQLLVGLVVGPPQRSVEGEGAHAPLGGRMSYRDR